MLIFSFLFLCDTRCEFCDGEERWLQQPESSTCSKVYVNDELEHLESFFVRYIAALFLLPVAMDP